MSDFGFSEVIPADTAALPAKTHNVTGGMREGADLMTYLEEGFTDVVERVDELLSAETRLPTIVDPATESKATEYVKLIQSAIKLADQKRLAERAPYELASNQVHQFFKKMTDSLGDLKKRVERSLTDYKVAIMREEQRKRDEAMRVAREAERARLLEAARLQAEADAAALAASRKRNAETRAAAEAEAERARKAATEAADNLSAAAETRANAEQEAAAPAADMTRARGQRGGVSSLAEFPDFRDIDRAMLDLEALRFHFTTEAVEMALRSYMKANKGAIDAGQQIKGCTFFKNHRVGVR